MQYIKRNVIQKISVALLCIGLAGSSCVQAMQGAQSENSSLAQAQAGDQAQDFSVRAKNYTGNSKSDNGSARALLLPKKTFLSHNTSHSALDKKFNSTYIQRLRTWTREKYNRLIARLPHISKRSVAVGGAAACVALLWYKAEKDKDEEEKVDKYKKNGKAKIDPDGQDTVAREKHVGDEQERYRGGDEDTRRLAMDIEYVRDESRSRNKPRCYDQTVGNEELFTALKNRKTERALTMIKGGVDVHMPSYPDNMQPLYAAVFYNNDVEVIRELCKQGADINAPHGEVGLTPLHMAIAQGRHGVDAVQELCAQGANINIKDKRGLTPLMLISYNFARPVNEQGKPIDIEMMKIVLEKNKQDAECEALFAAKRAEQIAQFAQLSPVTAIISGYLEKPSLLEATDDKGQDALFYAAQWAFAHSQFEYDSGRIDALIAYGADFNKKYPVGESYPDLVKAQYPDGWTLFESTFVENPARKKKDEQLRKVLIKNAMLYKNKALIKQICKLVADAPEGEFSCCIESRDYHVQKSIKENNIPLITLFCECASELQDQSLKDQLSGYVKEITVEEDAQELKDRLLSLVTSDSVEKEDKQDDGVRGLDSDEE